MNSLYKFVAFAILFIVVSCNPNKRNNLLRVATAANLRFAMEEVNAAFEVETGIEVETITASSGKLTAQIKSGAPYDVFLSANYKYPNKLHQEGFSSDKPKLFCKGHLVIWTNKNLSFDSTLISLTDPSIEKIAIANPQTAPYGIAAEELLKNLKLYDKIKSKLIYAENVAQLNQYVLNKAVSVGITAKSAVLASKLKGVGKWENLPLNSYSSVQQYVIGLRSAKTTKGKTEKYLSFLSSLKAKEILKDYGYIAD